MSQPKPSAGDIFDAVPQLPPGQANEATQGTNASILRTVVRADILLGRTGAAKVHEREALAVATPERWRSSLVSLFRSLHLDDFLLRKDYAGANRFMEESAEQNPWDADTQNAIAWALQTDPRHEVRDLELAESVATAASQTATTTYCYVQDALARALFMRGKKAEAIALQEKVLASAPTPRLAKVYQGILDSYKADKLPPAGMNP